MVFDSAIRLRGRAAAPNILLLDEPTNHLDLVTVEWLERFLQEQACRQRAQRAGGIALHCDSHHDAYFCRIANNASFKIL